MVNRPICSLMLPTNLLARMSQKRDFQGQEVESIFDFGDIKLLRGILISLIWWNSIWVNFGAIDIVNWSQNQSWNRWQDLSDRIKKNYYQNDWRLFRKLERALYLYEDGFWKIDRFNKQPCKKNFLNRLKCIIAKQGMRSLFLANVNLIKKKFRFIQKSRQIIYWYLLPLLTLVFNWHCT